MAPMFRSVLVTENRYKPGASSAMRERGERVSRSMTDGTMERIYNGKADYVVYTVTLKK